MPRPLTEQEIDQLVRLTILSDDFVRQLESSDGVNGQIGDSLLFKVTKLSGFRTIYRIDLTDADGVPVRRYVVHRHTAAIPKGNPDRAVEVYGMDAVPVQGLSARDTDDEGQPAQPKTAENGRFVSPLEYETKVTAHGRG